MSTDRQNQHSCVSDHTLFDDTLAVGGSQNKLPKCQDIFSPPPSIADLRNMFASPTVKVYPRHTKSCPKRNEENSQDVRNCRCPKWIYLHISGRPDRRFSAKTSSWAGAEHLKREIEDRFDPLKGQIARLKSIQHPTRVTISYAIESYLSDVRVRNLAPRTQKGYFSSLTRLAAWSETSGLHFIDELTTPQLTRWRSTWTDAPGTMSKRREQLSTFFNFCVRQDWLQRNPARYLSPMKSKRRQTEYFPPPEFEKLVNASRLLPTAFKTRSIEVRRRRELMALVVLVMRSSGLALGDAICLERARLGEDDKLFLYRSKTGEPVNILLEKDLAAGLRRIPVGLTSDASHFFWNGSGTTDSLKGAWYRDFCKLFEIANIRYLDGTLKRCHSHMLRDTFAVELLLAGVQIEEVSMLLGHSSIRTTERYYSPWVRARQEKLDCSVRKAHQERGITGTRAVSEVLSEVTAGNGRPTLFDSQPGIAGGH